MLADHRTTLDEGIFLCLVICLCGNGLWLNILDVQASVHTDTAQAQSLEHLLMQC